jgi:phage gpG-like protein
MEFPNWIFLDMEKYEDEKYHAAVKWDSTTDEDGVKQYIEKRDNVMKKVFNIHELHKIRKLVFHQGNEPSYEPRKITRTLESKSVYPYRIKTDLELRKEFGNNWRTTVCRDIGWNIGMDHLLGMEYPVADFKKEDHKDDEWIDMDTSPEMSWIIMPKLLTRNVPTYTPRKINRTLESVDNPKYKAIVYKLNSQKEFTEIQYKLFREGILWCTQSNRIETEKKYPIYVFVTNKDRSTDKQFFYDCVDELEEGSIEGVLGGRSGIRTGDICPYIFDINTKQTAERLFDYEGVPNYTPRKIVRTLESFDSKEVFQSNLMNGKYGAICFRINTPEENTRGHRYMKELGFIRNLDRFYTNSTVLVFFTVTNSDFNTFQLLTAGQGDQIKDGSLARGFSFELSPIFSVDEMIEYMESHRVMAVNMYKPRKISRTLEAVNQPDIKYMVVCGNRADSLKFEDLLVKAGYMWGTNRVKGYLLDEYPSIDSVSYCDFDTEGKSFTGFEYDKIKNDSTWQKIYGDYQTINYPRDVQTILSLEKKMRNIPTYEPRKIKRTLEANNFEQSLIKKIQSVLTKDLLIPEWAKKLEQGKHHPFAGHCYAASEALYHLLGGKEKGYKPMRGKGLNNETHWWIVDKDGNKLDPTAEQFYFVGLKPPYEAGKGSGFLTKNPSKRAQEIIKRITNI